ncbi:hypothetical protein TSUD_151940 [Trifolium subterraneum]|uniref:Ornithine cyclodeaminase/mu-crystallin family protein n=1 Tax=Trifolium subterraneum TaxID=3900 RepID=A0A2Z6N9Y1_TRISU|nr:hypothetical protein TSUD_151940 [Trifolium subterraneum]
MASSSPIFISTENLRSILTHQTLINHIQTNLPKISTFLQTPIRQHYNLSPSSSLLLMPSWSSSSSYPYIGVQARHSLRKVLIWNTKVEKAETLAKKMSESEEFSVSGLSFEGVGNLDEVVGFGDIVSCATNSETPLVKGERLKIGAHLDLVGSFKHSMKECDDEALKRGKVFVDNEAALVEAGELVGGFERGVIKEDKVGRSNLEEITVFKSVGSAVVDMLASQFVYEIYTRK